MVHNNITYKVQNNMIQIVISKIIKTLRGSSQKGKLGSLYLGRPIQQLAKLM